MKNDLKLTNRYLKYRSLSKRIQQLSFSLNETEKDVRFSEVTPQQKQQFCTIYENFGLDVEDISKSFQRIKEEL